MPHASVHAPDGWKRMDELVSTLTSAGDDDTSSLVSLGDIESFAGRSVPPSELVDNWYATNPFQKRPKELPVEDLDGVQVYHLAGMVNGYTWLEEFGAVVDDRIVTLSFNLNEELSRQEQQEVVDSVVATFQWK